MIDWLLPVARVAFVAPWSRSEFTTRLRTLDDASLAGFKLASVTDSGFVLIRQQRPWYRVPYLPVVHARLADAAAGTAVEVSLHAQISELVVVYGIFGAALVQALLAHTSATPPLIFAGLYHVGGLIFGFWPSQAVLERVLAELMARDRRQIRP